MRLRRPLGLLLAALLGSAFGAVAGCNLIVGAGDYSVGGDASVLHAEGGADGGKDGQAKKDAGPDAHGGLLGDPCTMSSQCTHGTCDGVWCTEPCKSNAACGSNSNDNTNYCVPNGNGEFACVPGCKTDADCINYGAGSSCGHIDGGTAYVCSPPTLDASTGDGGIIGDPCSTQAGGTGCSVGSCNGSWCETTCASATDTSCGSNSLGVPNSCANTGTDYECFPGCTTNTDCSPYAGTTCSPNVAGSTSAGYSCSSTYGVNGDPCSDSDASPWTACTGDEAGTESCFAGEWCSEPCTGSGATTCGSSTTGQANYCVSSGASSDGGSTYWCFPGCTTGDDCASYPDTFCEPIFAGGSGLICAGSGGQIGDPCDTDSDCTEGTCLANWCSQSCSPVGSSTACGTNSAGMTNYCILDTDDKMDHCFPGCKPANGNADCTPYPGATCQTLTGGETICGY